jgi:metal-sulfur cluster biosynthetic enzyme
MQSSSRNNLPEETPSQASPNLSVEPEPADSWIAPEWIGVWDENMKAQVTSALKDCFDPEIPSDIYELGLIYSVCWSTLNEDGISESPKIIVRMTLTSPNCPAAESLPRDVKDKVESLSVAPCEVVIVWEPTWTPQRMSDEARLKLNLF